MGMSNDIDNVFHIDVEIVLDAAESGIVGTDGPVSFRR